MMELFLVVGREGRLHKEQLGRFRVDVREKKCHSKCSLVVPRLPRGTLDQSMALCFKEWPVRVKSHQ